MKLSQNFRIGAFTLILLTISTNLSCSDNETNTPLEELESINLSIEDKGALLFMLEEEKLARDTYEYLDDMYGINQFSSIKLSEQSHMDAITRLLDKYAIEYEILPYGEFKNEEMQDFYNQFVEKGQIDEINALEVGATIEDLDIVDLDDFIAATSNTAISSVFEKLQCGSRNHLRSFVKAIQNTSETYEPQFLSSDEFNEIIDDNNERCGR